MTNLISSKVPRFFNAIFGSRNDRLLKNYFKQVEIINSLEVEVSNYNSSEIKQKTTEFKKRFEAGEKLSDLLPESFAIVRETSKRVLGMRHFDEQLVGGMALHDGKIAEMKTGEGKTLVATLPAYLNCVSGKSVHVITVNDYLARRDAEWMGQIFEALGITVGVVLSQMESSNRKAAYSCDVTYGTNNEFGFDYLRDNMAFQVEQRVQRDLTFAIVDEVDSILIDEARTPLIISGPADDKSDIYRAINKIVPMLTPQMQEDGEGDFAIDEKSRQVHLTEEGHERLEKILVSENLIVDGESLYSANNVSLMQYVNAAIRAAKLFQKNTDYVIKNREIVIVDEFTGRTMPGRRWSEGLHQAIEAKEGLNIQAENQTLATVTYQNYFRQYDKLSGMTGTADTEAAEFQEIYQLEVVVVPTHMMMIRDDRPDLPGRSLPLVRAQTRGWPGPGPVGAGLEVVEATGVQGGHLWFDALQAGRWPSNVRAHDASTHVDEDVGTALTDRLTDRIDHVDVPCWESANAGLLAPEVTVDHRRTGVVGTTRFFSHLFWGYGNVVLGRIGQHAGESTRNDRFHFARCYHPLYGEGTADRGRRALPGTHL